MSAAATRLRAGGAARKRNWLISGASSEAGTLMVRTALGAGDSVLATGRDPDALAARLGEEHPKLLIFQLDLSSAAQTALAARTAFLRFGRIDVLVDAAVPRRRGSDIDIDIDPAGELERLSRQHLSGLINLTRAALPYMRPGRSGHIIHFPPGGGVRAIAAPEGAGRPDVAIEQVMRTLTAP